MKTLSRLLPALIILLAGTAHALCPFGPTARRIIGCREGVPTAICRQVAEAIGCNVVREIELINAIVVEVADGGEDPGERLKSAPEVQFVDSDRSVNWLRSTLGEFRLPPIADIIRQTHEPKPPAPKPAAPADPEIPWGIRRVNAPAAWSRTLGRGARVAVIDTGIDPTHPELAGVVAGGFNAVNPAAPGDYTDDQGHGTHVAGTIAAARNGEGVVGVAPGAKLYGVKVLDKEGNGDYSTIIAGIDWAVKNRMHVVNMSLGADEGLEALRLAVAAAARAGVIIVAAAGNSSGPVSFPALYPEVVAVSASDPSDKMAFFSSFGPEVDFIAPGVGVKSLALGGGFATHDGTSMACPHVAGLAALAAGLGRTGAALRASLKEAATPLPGLTAVQQGAGLIDTAKLR